MKIALVDETGRGSGKGGSGEGGPAAFGAAARRSLAQVMTAGVEVYDRRMMLPRLVRATPAELEDDSPAMRRILLARLARALRAERNRGRAGHWTYDLNRHIGLRQAYIAEKAAEKKTRSNAVRRRSPTPLSRRPIG